MSRGALIVLEGIDRCGKSTQCQKLVEYLKQQGTTVEAWAFPDRTTPLGGMINSYLKSEAELDDRAIHLLFSANRWEKWAALRAKLEKGVSVVVDRYAYSGVAFSAAKGLDTSWCMDPDRGLIKPDIVLYFKLKVEEAKQRGGFGEERYEVEDFQKKVASTFEQITDSSWKIIDATRDVEDIHKINLHNLTRHANIAMRNGGQDITSSFALISCQDVRGIVEDVIRECDKGKPIEKLWTDEAKSDH